MSAPAVEHTPLSGTDDPTLIERAFDAATDAMVIADAEGVILRVNDAYCQLFDRPAEEVIGRRPSIVSSGHHDPSFHKRMWHELHTTGQWSGEVMDRRADGAVLGLWLRIVALKQPGSGTVSHYLGTLTNLQTVVGMGETLQRLSQYDRLTGLPNRTLITEKLSEALDEAGRNGRRIAVMMINLCRFRDINDSLGHMAGDMTLMAVAERFRAALPSHVDLARLSGDEFVAVADVHPGTMSADALATSILQSLIPPIPLDGVSVEVDVAVGVARFPKDAASTDTILRAAGEALKRAQDNPLQRVVHYGPDLTGDRADSVWLTADLRAALARDKFELFIQPQVDTATGALTGGEVLVRWRKPDGTLGGPAEFLPHCERTGLILDIDRRVITKTCTLIHHWIDHGLIPPHISINCSSDHFTPAAGLCATLEQASNGRADILQHITIELTETGIVSDPDGARLVMSELAELGVTVAVDDFGTGYAGLNYLTEFPIGFVKLDQTLTATLGSNREKTIVQESLIEMAARLGVWVVAEGVETEQQRKLLTAFNCPTAQGYLFAPPMSADDFTRLIAGAKTAYLPREDA